MLQYVLNMFILFVYKISKEVFKFELINFFIAFNLNHIFVGLKKSEKECKALRKANKELEEALEKLKLENRQVVFSVLTGIVRNNCKSTRNKKQIAKISEEFRENVKQVDELLELSEEDIRLIYGDTQNPFKDICFKVETLKEVKVGTVIDELSFRADTLVKENRRIKEKLIRERYDFQSKYKKLMFEYKDLELKHECLKTENEKL